MEKYNRNFYFLQDTISNQFYTGQNNWKGDFRNAAVYYSEDSAKKHIQGIIQSWEHEQKYPWLYLQIEVNKRKDLCKWGIIIVKGNVIVEKNIE